MRLEAGVLYEGIDLSNWQGELSEADVTAMWAEGKRFAIVRLSFETPQKTDISRQQIQLLQWQGIEVVGYLWCYWFEFATTSALKAAAVANYYGIKCVAMDAEDKPVPGIDSAIWLNACAITLLGEGIIPIAYSDPNWWQSNNIDVAQLGDIRWWVAEWNDRHDLNVTLPYVGARVVGHQYTDIDPINLKNYDSDVMVFDAEMLGGSVMEPGAPLTAQDVRAIVRDELDSIAKGLQQGDSFSELVGAIVDRMDAAGRAMDLHEQRPGHIATSAPSGDVAGPPEAYGDFGTAHPAPKGKEKAPTDV